MKRLIYILFLMIGLTACNDQVFQVSAPDTEGKVTLDFGIRVPEGLAASRSMTAPQVTSLYLLVFDADGYLREVAPAQRGGKAEGATEATQFSVTLTSTAEKRIIHFVANYDASNVQFGSESQVIGAMETTGDQDAYWQRMVFENGIANDDATRNKMNPVYLVRNFAKITVVSNAFDAENPFTLKRFAVVNVPTSGKVAPYHINGDASVFVNYYREASPLFYSDITGTGYDGFMPSPLELTNKSDDAGNLQFVEVAPMSDEIPTLTGSFYMYERTHPDDITNTFLLIEASYGTEADEADRPVYYYKLDLVHQSLAEGDELEYYHLLRNFEYWIQIQDVKSKGWGTVQEAIANPASNNFVGSVEAKSLLNISDGTARLFVSYTDTILTSSAPFTLTYKYLRDMNATATSSNDDIKIEGLADGGVDDDEAVIAGYEILSSDDEDGYRTIRITPHEPGAVTKTQTIKLTNGAGLFREVNFTLRKQEQMTVVCHPDEVLKQMGTHFDLYIEIEPNLPESLFPLDFLIESDKLSIYPDQLHDYMPVRFGKSIVTGKEAENSFAFVKTLTYEDYMAKEVYDQEGHHYRVETTPAGKKRIVCCFNTNIAESASTVYVYNKYFTLGQDAFTNVDEINIGNLTLTESVYYGVGNEVELTFNAKDTEPVTLIFDNLGYVSTLTGTMTLDAENSTEYSKYYTYTPNQAGTQTIKLSTTTFAEDGQVSLYNAEHAGLTAVCERKLPTIKLQITGTHGLTQNSYTRNVNIVIGDETVVGSCNITRERNGYNYTYYLTSLRIAEPLTLDTPIHFMYTYSGNTYKSASTTLGTLQSNPDGSITFSRQ